MPTIKELRSSISDHGFGFRRPILDYIALPITKLFITLRMTPNMITHLYFILCLLGAWILRTGRYWDMIIGISIFTWAYLIDISDGQVARYTKKQSYKGQYLDYVYHWIANTILLFSLWVALSPSESYNILVTLTIILYLLNKIININCFWPGDEKTYEKLNKKILQPHNNKDTSSSFLKTIIKIEEPINLMTILIIIHQAELIIPVYFLFFIASFIKRLTTNIKSLEKTTYD